jgi:ABC-type amino acid transport substrate-binding protein
MSRRTVAAFCLIAAVGVLAPPVHADATLDRIKARGTLTVGIVLDGTYGSLDPQTRKPVGVPIAVWQKAVPRLEWGVHYPLTDTVIKAQQDSADVAFRNKLIPRHIDVRQAIVDIR